LGLVKKTGEKKGNKVRIVCERHSRLRRWSIWVGMMAVCVAKMSATCKLRGEPPGKAAAAMIGRPTKFVI